MRAFANRAGGCGDRQVEGRFGGNHALEVGDRAQVADEARTRREVVPGVGIGLTVVDEIFENEVDRAHRPEHSSQTKVNSSLEDVEGLVGTVTAVFRKRHRAVNLTKHTSHPAHASTSRLTANASI